MHPAPPVASVAPIAALLLQASDKAFGPLVRLESSAALEAVTRLFDDTVPATVELKQELTHAQLGALSTGDERDVKVVLSYLFHLG